MKNNTHPISEMTDTTFAGKFLQARSPLSEAIAHRAYSLWQESGAQHGHDQEHWIQAEHQLKTEQSKSA